jgi:hypothetical protein
MSNLKRNSIWLWSGAVAALLALPLGCSSEGAPIDAGGASTEDITSTANISAVKRQSIGNCWIYAMTSWSESLEKAATKKESNYSESYLTYWHWFEQLANRSASTEIETGGSYYTAAGLIDRYGMMLEKDFIPNEGTAEMSTQQKTALDAMNAWLKSGGLTAAGAPAKGTPAYRGYIIAQLNKVWSISPARAAKLSTVFGENVVRTVDKAYATKAPGNEVVRARDILTAIPDMTQSKAGKVVINPKLTLQDAIGTGSSFSRSGTHAWRETSYPFTAANRRAFYTRIQRSLHDGVPVLSSWFIDFNALTRDSHFSKVLLDQKGVGRQGGHMTLLVDYAATDASGKVYPANKDITDAATLAKLLDPSVKINSLVTKNSWGTSRPDRWDEAVIPGYHTLDFDYLDGPLQRCEEVNGVSDPKKCSPDTGMQDIVLAPIYSN